MNIKRDSLAVLGLVLGVSVLLYIFDAPVLPSSGQAVPTIPVPTLSLSPSARVFTESVDYGINSFNEKLIVTLTVENATIKDVLIGNGATDGESAAYQEAFASAIKPMVVGKNIRDINVSKVAGASNTTEAFMEAVKRISSSI